MMCTFIKDGNRLPRMVNLPAIRQCLDSGSTRQIGSVFSWATSPQGFYFWERELEESSLSPQARAYLEQLLVTIEGRHV